MTHENNNDLNTELITKNTIEPTVVQIRKDIKVNNDSPKISGTRYFTHGVYKYPATFIPQIIRYCLVHYVDQNTNQGGAILDPFGGCGTTALEAYVKGYNATLEDINPLLEDLMKLKCCTEIRKKIETLVGSDGHINTFFCVDDDLTQVKKVLFSSIEAYSKDLFNLLIPNGKVELDSQKNLMYANICRFRDSELDNIFKFDDEIKDTLKAWYDVSIGGNEAQQAFYNFCFDMLYYFRNEIEKLNPTLNPNDDNLELLNELYLLFLFSFLSISRKYSVADHETHKLTRSKQKLEKNMLDLTSGSVETKNLNNFHEFLKDFENTINKNIEGMIDFAIYTTKQKKDSNGTTQVDKPIVLIKKNNQHTDANQTIKESKQYVAMITSPPYMQAQEYTRSIKFELYWKGVDVQTIKGMASQEIPYNNKSKDVIGVAEKTFHDVKSYQDIKTKVFESKTDLQKEILFASYFQDTIKILDEGSKLVKKDGVICIFVGSPKMNGVQIDIWRVIKEYFENQKDLFRFETVIADPISNRYLAKNRKGENPNGMEHEFLLVFKKLK
jgi:hypothetical protein